MVFFFFDEPIVPPKFKVQRWRNQHDVLQSANTSGPEKGSAPFYIAFINVSTGI